MLESGQVIAGKYRLNQILGTGGMASVWSATNTFTERQFAIKFLLPSVAKTKEAVDRFLKEAKVSARIDHPNIIEVIDVGQTDDGSLFLVMELLTGVTLETALRRQQPPMTLSELTFVMVEVARALSAAHRSGVIHRDLKPTNIFLHKERDGRPVPKVLDFGVSKFLGEETGKVHALTIAGTVLGSPLYMSPEQARGEIRIDGRSDIFSFGAILFEALCGTRPFDAPNFNALIVKIATGKPKSIDEEAPHVPESMRGIVRDCLASDPALRPATFDHVAERLMLALPDLESAQLRIPAPASGLLPSDPDATSALPVVRPSDRPPAMAYHHSPSVPPPSATPQSTTISQPPPPPPRPNAQQGFFETLQRNPTALLLMGGVAFAVVVIGVAALFTVSHMQSASGAANAEGSASSRTHTTRETAPEPTVPPVIHVDMLPSASGTSKARGHLSIASEPLSCLIAIDGVPRGPTPIQMVELTPGAHTIECVPSRGKTQRSTVRVFGGASDRFVFKIEP
ncbi:MAG: serine/threonine-protein kinase [Polyangiaceae bacterium]